VSVVALSWNGREHLETCLPTLCQQTYEHREIILVDNGSTDGTSDWVRATYPEVEVARVEQNRGVPGGLNYGIRRARGEFIALVNNDTEVDRAWLAESICALNAHPETGFTASRVRLFYKRTHLDTTGDMYFSTGHASKRGWLLPDGPEFDRGTWVFGASGAAAVYRRRMLDEIGLFDEDYHAGLEDLDLSFRAQLVGYRCRYVPSAIVYHKVGATLGAGPLESAAQERLHRNLWRTLIKNLPGRLWVRYLAQILFAEVVVHAAALRNGRLGPLLRARAAVLRELPQILKERSIIQAKRRASIDYLDSLIRKDWMSHRRDVKQRESNFGTYLIGERSRDDHG
jgi:GT2 family glycosyltransferase